MYILPSTPDLQVPSAILAARQATSSLPTGAQPVTSCPGQYSGGTLAGAILGTFFGTLLFLYLFSVIKACYFGGPQTEEVIVERKVRSSNSGSKRRSRRSGSHA